MGYVPNTAPYHTQWYCNSWSKSIDSGRICRNRMEMNVGLVRPIHLHKYIPLGIKEPVQLTLAELRAKKQFALSEAGLPAVSSAAF